MAVCARSVDDGGRTACGGLTACVRLEDDGGRTAGGRLKDGNGRTAYGGSATCARLAAGEQEAGRVITAIAERMAWDGLRLGCLRQIGGRRRADSLRMGRVGDGSGLS